MKYLSVCSGIEAATVAWHPLGWSPVAFSEIDKFPSAVLAHHYPNVPNLSDMSKYKEWPDADVDVLVGGTPCQSFSVAGLRKGLADPRGNLALTYLGLVDRYRPEWFIWENVPGVLSQDGGRAFGSILGGVVELGYGFAYRVIDAQFVRVDGFGRAVPQRRRRVFVVGNSRTWRRAAAVLFERESLSWNSAPRREARQAVAGAIGDGSKRSGGCIGRREAAANHIIATDPVARCDTAGYSQRIDAETENFVAHALRAEGFDASEDGTVRGTPLVPIAFDTTQITSKANRSAPQEGDPCHPLAAGAHPPAVAFNWQSGGDCRGLEPRAVTMAITKEQTPAVLHSVAYDMRGREGGSQFEGPHDTASVRAAPGGSSRSYVAQQWAVRRLTPRECERLQGFPDDYTLIPVRGKLAADGPRYKALGNSMAVNVMRWIGVRIQMVSGVKP